MTREDRDRWDARYADAPVGAPAPGLVARGDALPRGGVALDVACGTGANALYVAGRGPRVVAMDGSRVALRTLDAEARRRGLRERVLPVLADTDALPAALAARGGSHSGCGGPSRPISSLQEPRRTGSTPAVLRLDLGHDDLASQRKHFHHGLPGARLDAVLCWSFLDRRLLSGLAARLAPGGVLLLSAFHDGVRRERPMFRREWTLRRGEGPLLFPELEVIEAVEDDLRTIVLARRPG